MLIQGTNLETGTEFQTTIDGLDDLFINEMTQFELSEEQIKKTINNLNVSADIKSLLFQFSRITLKIGDFMLKVGRKIIEFVCMIYKEYKNATFGIIFGALVGLLISSIPILGIVLGPLFSPIAIGLGLVIGVNEDLKDMALARKISEINAKFSQLEKANINGK